jgi:ferric-dicitrate binding protein FerR (iron transport regulator)
VRELLFGQQALPLVGGTPLEEHHMLTDDGGRLGVVEMTRQDIEAHDAWRTNMLVFDEMPLQQVAAEFNRYNRRKIEIDDETIARVPISGRYKTSDTDGFLERLGAMMAIRVVDGEDAGDKVLRVHGVRRQGTSR